jgi:hypothetical protein
MLTKNDKAIHEAVKKRRKNWSDRGDKNGGGMVVLVGQRESISNRRSSILLFRFPKQELWLPESETEEISRFSDAGFVWTVAAIPGWLFEEEASEERNLYEERISQGKPVTGPGVPVGLNEPWSSTDRSIWLHGQVSQILADYDRDWAADHGEIMSDGVKESVNPTGQDGRAVVEVKIPCPSEAEEVIGNLRRLINSDVGEVTGEEVREEPGEITWRGSVYAPRLIW